MKRLSILRHAKAAKSDGLLADIDRPLTEQGRDDAARVGGFIKQRGLTPDHVLCSSSTRTRETLKEITVFLNAEPRIDISDRLYNASQAVMLEVVRAAPAEASHVMLIGHNPGVHSLALSLTGPSRAEEKTITRMASNFPPGALTVLEFSVASWPEIDRWSGALLWFTTPVELRTS